MDTQTVKKIVKEELPVLLKRDKDIRRFLIELSQEQLAKMGEKSNMIETKMDRQFDQVLEELRRDREAQSRKWEKHEKKWEEKEERWEKRWEEQDKRWAEQEKKWEENQEQIRQLFKKTDGLSKKYDTTLGALGARWGTRSEASFRNALKSILAEFNVEVLHVEEYDDEGEVFGRPEQIELDIVIVNGKTMIGELKSSVSQSEVYSFERKARFYEKRHNRKAVRLFIVSPMVDDKAMKTAEKLGIRVYSYADQMGEDILK
jgi:hypothetical protein